MVESHKSGSIQKPARQRSRGARVAAGVEVTGRRQRRAAETRMKIFRSALVLIAERGLPNVTVEAITEAADVGKGTFFNYFETKDHVLGVMAQIQLGKIREAGAQVTRGGQSAYGVLHKLAHQLSEEPGRSAALARALISSFLGSDSVREIVKRTMFEGRKTVGEIIAAGQRQGEIQSDLRKEKIAMQFIQCVLGTVLIWSLNESPPLNSLIEDSFQHFWSAISVSGRERQQ